MGTLDVNTPGELVQIALKAAGIGCWSWDVASDILTWDDHAAEILGPWQEPVRGTALFAAIPASEQDSVKALWRRALGSDGQFQCECPIVRPCDGDRRWLSLSGRAEYRDGVPIRVVGVLRDTGERREAQMALEAASARLSGIVSIATDAIVAVDEARRITLFNVGAETIFGYSASEVIGRPLSTLLPERFRAGHGNYVNGFGASGVQARRMGERSQIWGRRKSGDAFPAEASISHVVIGGKSVYTAVVRDVTAARKLQALLEQRVEESTRELRQEMRRREESQAQLIRTQRMEAFGQLTGGIAHDFNNLLTVITGNHELLEMRLTDEKSRVLLQRAQAATDRGTRLTSRLLTFARRRVLAASPLNVNEVVLGMAELLERALGETITLTTSLERAPWTVSADQSEIENAILNLAINARDAMSGGGKLIIETSNVTVDTTRPEIGSTLTAGAYLRLSVADSGSGMTPEVLRHAFEPFFTTKEPGKGTGLGLSTIYGLATQAGGAATIYSEVGHGTTVAIYLPADRTATRAGPQSKPEAPDTAVAAGHVLLVEDNADVRDVTSSQLEAIGYTVTAVASGPEALRALAAPKAFDVVLSDVVMAGGMSGLDVARWIKANCPGLPVVLASGFPDAALRSEAALEALPRIMHKPFTRRELAEALKEARAAPR